MRSPSRTDASLENITLDEVKEKVRLRAGFGAGIGDKAGEIVDAYARVFPDKKPIEIWSMISSNRKNLLHLQMQNQNRIQMFTLPGSAGNRLFLITVCGHFIVRYLFLVHNTDLMITHTGGGSRPRKLSDKMAGALVQFMKTGNPNEAGLPDWPVYSSENGETMVLNDTSEVHNDPDREARKSLPV